MRVGVIITGLIVFFRASLVRYTHEVYYIYSALYVTCSHVGVYRIYIYITIDGLQILYIILFIEYTIINYIIIVEI